MLIFEKMFENRLVFTDKLVLMGAHIILCDPHRAVISGPDPAARRAAGVARHPRRHGDADRGAVRGRRLGDRQRPPDRPRLRADRRAPARRSARASSARSRSFPARVSTIHPTPSGTRDVLPDEMREMHAVTEAIRARVRRARLRRGPHAGARVRAGADARRPGGGRSRLQAVRRAGQRARAALGHDDPDRARRLHPLRDARAAAALLLRRPRLPLRAAAARAGPRDAAGRDRARRRARRRRARPRR